MKVEIEFTALELMEMVRQKFPELPEEGWSLKYDAYISPIFVWSSRREEPAPSKEEFLA